MSCKFYFEPILDWFMATFGPKTSTQNLPQENHINVKSLCYGNNIQKNQRESNATLFNKTWKTTFCVSFFSFNNYATLCKKSQKLSVKFSYLSPSRVPLYQKKKIFLKKIIKSILKTPIKFTKFVGGGGSGWTPGQKAKRWTPAITLSVLAEENRHRDVFSMNFFKIFKSYFSLLLGFSSKYCLLFSEPIHIWHRIAVAKSFKLNLSAKTTWPAIFP